MSGNSVSVAVSVLSTQASQTCRPMETGESDGHKERADGEGGVLQRPH